MCHIIDNLISNKAKRDLLIQRGRGILRRLWPGGDALVLTNLPSKLSPMRRLEHLKTHTWYPRLSACLGKADRSRQNQGAGLLSSFAPFPSSSIARRIDYLSRLLLGQDPSLRPFQALIKGRPPSRKGGSETTAAAPATPKPRCYPWRFLGGDGAVDWLRGRFTFPVPA